jgi:PPOX class probable F420-dependent enzyme
MARSPRDLSPEALDFLAVRHLATLTTQRRDGSPHVTPVGFTWDAESLVVRVITSRTSQKAVNADRGGRAAVCQVEGRHWLTLEGSTRVVDDAVAVADAERRYAARYREPRPNPHRVVVEIAVDRVLGNV